MNLEGSHAAVDDARARVAPEPDENPPGKKVSGVRNLFPLLFDSWRAGNRERDDE